MPPPSHPHSPGRDESEPIRNWNVQSWHYEDEWGNRGELVEPAPAPPSVVTRTPDTAHHEEILRRLDRIENFYRGQQEADTMRTLLMNLGDPYNRQGEQISEELIAHSPLLQLFVRRMQEYGFVRRLRAGTVTIMPPVNQARVPEPVFNAETVARARGGPAPLTPVNEWGPGPDRNGDVITPELCRQLMEEALLCRQLMDEAQRISRMRDDGTERERPDAPDGSAREQPNVINTPGFIPSGPMREAMLAAGGREDPPGSGIFPPSAPNTRDLMIPPEVERSIPEEIGDGEEL